MPCGDILVIYSGIFKRIGPMRFDSLLLNYRESFSIQIFHLVYWIKVNFLR